MLSSVNSRPTSNFWFGENSMRPVTGRVQYSTSQKLDIGLEFTLLNVKPPSGQSPIDNRFLALFVQSRFGK